MVVLNDDKIRHSFCRTTGAIYEITIAQINIFEINLCCPYYDYLFLGGCTPDTIGNDQGTVGVANATKIF